MRSLPAEDAPSLSSRLIGSVIATGLAALSVVSLPWLLFWKYPIRAGLILGLPGLIFVPLFWIWVCGVALLALTLGFRLGVYDLLDVLNLLWGTGESHDQYLQALAHSIRTYVILSAIITYLLLCLR